MGKKTKKSMIASQQHKYSMLNAYGSKVKFLSQEEINSATAADRIQSIWPFVAQKVMSHWGKSKPWERIHFDPDDLMVEIWIELEKKNDRYDPSRGLYVTFAGRIVDRKLIAIWEHSRTVHLPRNSAGRLSKCTNKEDSGEPAEKINRCMRPVVEVDPEDKLHEDQSTTEKAESLAEIRKRAARVIRSLDAKEAYVVGHHYGLWGMEPTPIQVIAERLGLSVGQARALRAKAERKIRAIVRKNL